MNFAHKVVEDFIRSHQIVNEDIRLECRIAGLGTQFDDNAYPWELLGKQVSSVFQMMIGTHIFLL